MAKFVFWVVHVVARLKTSLPRKPMKPGFRPIVLPLLTAAAFAASAHAQTTAPAKPAATKGPSIVMPAAPPASKTATLGKGTAGGPLLTREELRVCLAQEPSIRTRLAEIEANRAKLDAEKATIAADQQSLRAERSPIDELKTQADALAARIKAYGARVESWNQRSADPAAAKRGSEGDKLREQLNKEREELGKDSAALEADKAKLNTASQEAVAAYNGKAQTLDARVSAWNERNGKANEAATALEAERKAWVSNCADKRYNEDDEIAIRKGK
jgi:chromosome segregation ATPase